jgi:hypothetical protein
VKIIKFLLLALITLLSIVAGLAKVMQAPREMEFLQGMGWSSASILVFGLVQIAAGVMLVLPKTRLPGAILAASAFVVSAVMVFNSGNLVFGLVSLVPVSLAGLIIYQAARRETQ